MLSTDYLQKTLRYLSLLLVLILVFGQYACDSSGGGCGEEFPVNVFYNPTSFRVVNDSGIALIGSLNGAMYSENDVTVRMASGEEPPGLSVSHTGTFGFYISDIDEELDQPHTKTYYLILPPPPGSNESDIDTITAEYQARKDRCNYLYDFMRIEYNDNIYTSDDPLTTWDLIKE